MVSIHHTSDEYVTLTEIGIREPADVGSKIESYSNEHTGMEYDIHSTTSGNGILLAASHVDVGLVVWWRVPTLAEAWMEVTAQ